MIDLHAHTTISDGSVSPAELIQLANKTGLKAIAITDHDSINGHDEAQKEADCLGIKLIKGIEFSVTFGNNRLIHILGLGIEPDCDEFMSIYMKYRKERSEKLTHVFQKLRALGIKIDRQLVAPFQTGAYMDRQAIAKYLYAYEYASTMKKAWVDYLDLIDYVPGELICPEDAFSAIHAAGGKAFMAHFHLHIGLKGYSEAEVYIHLAELKAMGLDGMEFYYPSYTNDDKLKISQYIEDFNFIKSGGTDFHGANRPNIELGIGEGDFSVPKTLLDNIKEERLSAVR